MKILNITLSLILLFVLTACSKDILEEPAPPEPTADKLTELLSAIPGVESVQELDKGEYKKHFLVKFTQFIDPENPSLGTFTQRVFVSHRDFNAPVVLEVQGYSSWDCMGGPRDNELTKHFNANCVEVEYRYAGDSRPMPLDWQYLTCENASADLHAVRVALGKFYTGSWIAQGVSKGGGGTMQYMMYYPDDLAAAVAYVGPICKSRNDDRFPTYMMNTCGTPKMRERLVNYQRAMIERRATIQPLVSPYETRFKAYQNNMTADQDYEYRIVNITFDIWQQGFDVSLIPLPDSSDEEMVDYMLNYNKPKSESESKFATVRNNEELKFWTRTLLGDEQFGRNNFFTKANSSSDTTNNHYTIQAFKELGYPAQLVQPLEDLIPDHASWSRDVLARYMVPAELSNIQFSDKLYEDSVEWLQTKDPRLICVYGEYDPWTAAAPDKAWFAGKTNMAMYVEKGGNHSATINKLAAGDKSQAWAKLDSWVKR